MAVVYVPIFIFDDDDATSVDSMPQYASPKMTWQQGEHSLSFALGRAPIEKTMKDCFVFWSEGLEASNGNFFAVERADYTMFRTDWIGFLHGAHSRAPFDDFDSSIKPMKAQDSFCSIDGQGGVKCKLWLLKEPKGACAVSMHSVRDVASVMAIMCDALSKDSHHEIRLDEARGAIASVQGPFTLIFSCDGGLPSSVATQHLPASFVPVPGPASSAPKAMAQHYDSKALLVKWDQVHISVWNGMLGIGVSSHKRAVSRCIQGPEGNDVGRKSFNLSLSHVRIIDQTDARCAFPHRVDNVLAVTIVNKDGSQVEHLFSFGNPESRQSFIRILAASGSSVSS